MREASEKFSPQTEGGSHHGRKYIAWLLLSYYVISYNFIYFAGAFLESVSQVSRHGEVIIEDLTVALVVEFGGDCRVVYLLLHAGPTEATVPYLVCVVI